MTAIYCADVGESEAPVWGPAGEFYLTEMAKERACVTRFDKGARTVVLETGGRPNGLALDGYGNLWVAEAGDPSVLCIAPGGEIIKRITTDGEGPFLWPNDLAFAPNGMLYLTDSGVRDPDLIDDNGIVPHFADLRYDGRVYEIDPARAVVTRTLDRGIQFTNGLAFGPDGRLYVNETLTGDVFSYDVSQAAPARRPFGNVFGDSDRSVFRGPDGMKFDEAGYLYCAVFNGGEVVVLDPEGAVVERLPVGGLRSTNLAFGPSENRIYVTEGETSSVVMLDVPRGGLPLHYPRWDR